MEVAEEEKVTCHRDTNLNRINHHFSWTPTEKEKKLPENSRCDCGRLKYKGGRMLGRGMYANTKKKKRRIKG